MSLLGLDVGTRHCRALIVSEDGSILAEARRSYPAESVSPEGWTVQPLWQAIRATLAEAASGAARDPVQALSVAAMGEAIAPLSFEGSVLEDRLLGASPGGATYVQQAEGALGRDTLFDLTGHVPGPDYALARIAWLQEQRPELARRVWRFVTVAGLVDHLLGGTSACDHSLAGGTLLFDMEQERWSRAIAEACDIGRNKLPELAPAGQAIGSIAPSLAAELGFKGKVQIILGGRDLACNALGAGVIGAGAALYHLGAGMYLLPVFEAIPLKNLLLRHGLSLEHHVVPGLFSSLLVNPAGGRILQWFRDQLAAAEAQQAQRRGFSFYTRLLEEMPAEPTDLLALGDFASPGAKPWSGGAIVGLRMDTTRGEVVKALLEGASYAFAVGLDTFERVGIRVHALRVTGGGARSDPWLQLAADILGRPIERTRVLDATALGAAIIAGVGSQVYANHAEATEALVQVEARFEPDPKRQRLYRQKLQAYQALRQMLQEGLPGVAPE
jgi:xylulokinase